MQQSEKLYQNLHPEHPGSIGPRRKGVQARFSFVRADGTRGWHAKALELLTKKNEQDIYSLLGQTR